MNAPGPLEGNNLSALLPALVLDYVRDRYLAGVAEAEAKYRMGVGDEDTLTGGLGNDISTARPLVVEVGDAFYVQIEYRRVRGRGAKAPEKLFGADGCFQLQVSNANREPVFRKGLPFQAKKNWKGVDRRLAEQARNMARTAHGGIVVDYTPNGYSACDIRDVIEFRGNRKAVNGAGKMNRLGQVLAHDFLDCRVGVRDLYYDSDIKRFAIDNPRYPREIIDTKIARVDLSRLI
jgi:hypothetical protein